MTTNAAGLAALSSGPGPHDHELDAGIAEAVNALRAAGVETFESCEGGDGHAFTRPTIRFHGDRAEGFRALAAAQRAGLRVISLRRYWELIENEPTGPSWELVLHVEPAGPAVS